MLGSELEAALTELRLLRELRPPANARGTRPERHAYPRGVHLGGSSRRSRPSGARSRGARAQGGGALTARPDARGGVARAGARMRLAQTQRFEDAPVLRPCASRRPSALWSEPDLAARAPGACSRRGEAGFERAVFVAAGQVVAIRSLPGLRAGAGDRGRPGRSRRRDAFARAGGRRRAPPDRLVPPAPPGRAANRRPRHGSHARRVTSPRTEVAAPRTLSTWTRSSRLRRASRRARSRTAWRTPSSASGRSSSWASTPASTCCPSSSAARPFSGGRRPAER